MLHVGYKYKFTLHSPVVTICTARFNIQQFYFCPHGKFMCLVWIWEQTAIISLYNINWLAIITETESFYCAVRTEFSAPRHMLSLVPITHVSPPRFSRSPPDYIKISS